MEEGIEPDLRLHFVLHRQEGLVLASGKLRHPDDPLKDFFLA